MRSIRLTAAASLAICATLVACTADTPSAPLLHSARAALPTAGAVHTTAPFSFVIPAGTCGLTTTVSGSGDYDFVSTTREGTPNGTRVVDISSVRAHGRATGGDGSEYTFNYGNHLRFYDESELTPSFTFVDNFHLIGKGAASNIGIGVRGFFSIDIDGNVTFVVEQHHGDFSCDVI